MFDSAFAGKTGVTWRAAPAQRALVDQHVRRIADWSKENGRPVFIGEFGTYHRADTVSRALYTEYVATAFTRAGFSWAMWNFSSDFGLVEDSTGTWRGYLGSALLRPGANPMLDSILAADIPIDLGRYVVWEDFEDSLPLLPSSAAGWQARQGRPADSSRASWYGYYSDTARLLLPDGSRLLRYFETGPGKAPSNFPAAIGPWGYDGKCLHLRARLQGSPYPHAGFGAGILGGWDSTYADLTRLTAIQFRAKGRGEWSLQVITDSIYFGYPKTDNWGQMSASFTPGPVWQDVVIPASTLAPKAWSKQAAEGLKWEDVRDRVIAIEFMNGQSYGLAPDDSLELWLDDIRLIGMQPKDLGLE